MSVRFAVTGTGTGVGKTVFCAALAGALGANYWKPIQAGLEGETDSETVRRLSGLPADRMIPEAYRLQLPASPHIAAAREGIVIEANRLGIPRRAGPLVIEGAGGLLVPLSPRLLQIDLFASWGLPVILCALTALGTINHTLLSLEAMAKRSVKLHGIVFIGGRDEEAESTILSLGKVRRLGSLPPLDPLNASRLAEAFRANFRLSDFAGRLSL
ncbi:MAG: ATP-dependent dethiobiotin synthetase BioD [Rhodomicrobium sp.]|nr:ATP-dependent dethiobiotin synthetase BioD [Rhodomicrobium sp.]